MPNWEKFTITGGRGVYEKRVSLSSRGVFTLNQPTFDEMGEPDVIEFLFDRELRLIGLMPSTEDVAHAYTVRKQKANKSYLIGARAFCYHYKIQVEQTIRFNDIKFEDGVLILDLENTTPVETRKAGKSAKDLRGNSSLDFDE